MPDIALPSWLCAKAAKVWELGYTDGELQEHSVALSEIQLLILLLTKLLKTAWQPAVTAITFFQ